MKIAILGYGVEGKSAEKFLNSSLGCRTTKCRIEIRDVKKQGKDYLKNLEKFDMVVRSPGIPYLLPEIQRAKKKGVKITSTTKLFFENAKGILVGITGTKGKGTTATLLYKILKASHLGAGHPSGSIHLVGNMGIPMLDELPKLKENSISILELSSFQLQDMDVSPHIAVVLDVSPDHLNYHKSFKEYLEAKAQLVKNQLSSPQVLASHGYFSAEKFLVLAPSRSQGLAKPASSLTLPRSFFPLVFFFPDNKFSKQIAQKGKGKKIAVLADKNLKLKIHGTHNLKNASMAAAIGRTLGIKEAVIKKTIQNFNGLPHRLEFVREVRGVKFYNDSASTNPGAAIAALKSFDEPKILIAGGASKGAGFGVLKPVIKNSNVKLIILFGRNQKEIGNALRLGSGQAVGKIIYTDNLRIAVMLACENTKKGDVILFSPASASFDQFSGYDERGELFKKYVRSLAG